MPDGGRIDNDIFPYTFPDYPEQQDTTYVGWRIPNPQPGEWKLVVKYVSGRVSVIPYQVLVSGQSSLTLHLLLPDRLGTRYVTGNSFPIYAILSGDKPIPGAMISATVTAPDCLRLGPRDTMVSLFDDGEHGDGNAGDGVYANLYTAVNCADVVQPPEEEGGKPSPAQEEGGYRVRLQALDPRFRREAQGAFAILEGGDENDNNLPDEWEKEHDVSNPNGDPDLDYLSTGDEYLAGTDPNNSDTDGGGENDGSEVEWGQDPLDPSDDEIEAPEFFHAAPQNGSVLLTYDVKDEYTKMELWRALGPGVDWNLRESELPLEGSFEDPATNGETYYYRLIAADGGAAAAGHRSAVLDSEETTPSIDPVPPQALVIINEGAASTWNRNVTLSFVPYEYEPEDPDGFSDIRWMKISNDPSSLPGVEWQDFTKDVPWELAGQPGELAHVYVRFRDQNLNESVGTEVGTILYNANLIYLPVVLRGQ